MICFFTVSHCPTELPWIQQWGVLAVGRIINFWHRSHISTHSFSRSLSRCLFLCVSLHPALCGRTERKRNTHGLPGGWTEQKMLLSNSHQPCVSPQGDRENSKHRAPAKTKKRTTVHPLTVVCLLCKGPCWLSITLQHAGAAKQPQWIMKRNKRAERQNSQRVKMLRDGT